MKAFPVPRELVVKYLPVYFYLLLFSVDSISSGTPRILSIFLGLQLVFVCATWSWAIPLHSYLHTCLYFLSVLEYLFIFLVLVICTGFISPLWDFKAISPNHFQMWRAEISFLLWWRRDHAGNMQVTQTFMLILFLTNIHYIENPDRN